MTHIPDMNDRAEPASIINSITVRGHVIYTSSRYYAHTYHINIHAIVQGNTESECSKAKYGPITVNMTQP